MSRLRRCFAEALLRSAFFVSLLAVGLAGGDVAAQNHVPELQARANFSGAFNLPDSAFFTNATPRLNDAGQVAFDLEVLPGAGQGLWFGGDGDGSVVYSSPVDTFILDVGLNDSGLVVFDLAQSAQDGVYRYDPGTGQTTFATNQPLGASGWSSPQINSSGDIAFRAGFPSGRAFVRVSSGTTTVYVAEAGIDVGSPYSFLFTPSFSDTGGIAAKVRRGAAGQVAESQPDEIRVFRPDGTSTRLAIDQNGDAGSPFQSFDNAVSTNTAGDVAFITTRVGGERQVLLASGGQLLELARESDAAIGTIEFFPPACGDDGSVAFRATDAMGLRAIWLTRAGGVLVRVAGEHDLVATDLGLARIDQHDSGPVFGGGLSVNVHREVAFNASLTPADNNQVEWGSGIFVARRSAEIFADGFDSGTASAWSLTSP